MYFFCFRLNFVLGELKGCGQNSKNGQLKSAMGEGKLVMEHGQATK